MKTDKIFYTLFQIFPELLFQLLGQPTDFAQNYQFQSVEIKELAFRLDGIFLPESNTLIVYKFPHKSRQELEAMFSLTEWKQTRFYQEAKEEGKLEGEQEGKLKTVSLLLKLGLTPEQIAEELEINIEKVRQFIASQNH